MKTLLLLIIPFCALKASAQIAEDKICGEYATYFGNYIKINSDHTFEYQWHFDMMSSWSRGTWYNKNDTLFFKVVPVFDTLKLRKANGRIVDSLMLSIDNKPELISDSLIDLSVGVGQNKKPCPIKLYYKKQKLFTVTNNGQISKRKIQEFWTRKKRNPWYFKIKGSKS